MAEHPCPECGQRTVPDARFCAYCGLDLLRQAAVPVFVTKPRATSNEGPGEPGSEENPIPTTRIPDPYPADIDPRSKRTSGLTFVAFGALALVIGIAGVFLLRQLAILILAFGVAFLAVGMRKLREARPPEFLRK